MFTALLSGTKGNTREKGEANDRIDETDYLLAPAYASDKEEIRRAYEEAAQRVLDEVIARGGDSWASRFKSHVYWLVQDNGADITRVLPQGYTYIARCFMLTRRTGAGFDHLKQTTVGKAYDDAIMIDPATADKNLFVQELQKVSLEHHGTTQPVGIQTLRAFFGTVVLHEGKNLGTARYCANEDEWKRAIASITRKREASQPKATTPVKGDGASLVSKPMSSGQKSRGSESKSEERDFIRAQTKIISGYVSKPGSLDVLLEQQEKLNKDDRVRAALRSADTLLKLAVYTATDAKDPKTFVLGAEPAKLVDDGKMKKKTLLEYSLGFHELLNAVRRAKNLDETHPVNIPATLALIQTIQAGSSLTGKSWAKKDRSLVLDVMLALVQRIGVRAVEDTFQTAPAKKPNQSVDLSALSDEDE
jgi:hypothetical protein